MKPASTEIGSARPVITVERHELRNTSTTRMVRIAPSISAVLVLLTDAVTRSPASRTMVSLAPSGRVALRAAIRSLSCVTTASVE
jgi:hypothetical protein